MSVKSQIEESFRSIAAMLGAESAESESPVTKSRLFVPIAKASDEEQTITGVVLQPEVVDAQGDIMDADVIRKAAHKFLAQYNRKTKPGLQHSTFKRGQFEIVESYLVPTTTSIGGQIVKEGSWVMTMKVLDSKIWKAVKDGKITGFSIGGRARAVSLKPSVAA